MMKNSASRTLSYGTPSASTLSNPSSAKNVSRRSFLELKSSFSLVWVASSSFTSIWIRAKTTPLSKRESFVKGFTWLHV